jgi:hypothetical protein
VFKGRSLGCITKLRLSWGLRVGYKVLLILLAMEPTRTVQNSKKSYRRSINHHGMSQHHTEGSRMLWKDQECTVGVHDVMWECSASESSGNQ